MTFPGGADEAAVDDTASGRDRMVHEGLEHLQRAARETIAAMRTLLDLAEDLVDDPRTGQDLVAGLSSLAEAGVRSGMQLTGKRRPSEPGQGDEGSDGGDGSDGVQRIPVS